MQKIHRPLPPHLTLYMSQLTSTFPISHRISGAFLATMVLFSPFLCPKMGLISLTYENFYQSSSNSSKFIPSSVGLTAFSLAYHLFYQIFVFVSRVRVLWHFYFGRTYPETLGKILFFITSFLCLATVFMILSINLDFPDWFHSVLEKVGFTLSSRALSCALRWVGCSAGLAFTVSLTLRVMLTGEGFTKFMMVPSGGSGSSRSNLGFDLNQLPEEVPSSSSLLEWEKALDLPDNAPAPEALRSHLKKELLILFHIGKTHSVPENYLQKVMDPLQLDSPEKKVGFFRKLEEKVKDLQNEHYNKGNHLPFPFQTKREKDRLYSVLRDE